ncbi:unnamed protein product [Clonostachys rosea]|uniref:CFEM domain-containing protein n=1 Tax=Bionectria ochroleuca TaxID=29856 RepID=A0ABY6U1R2_BIOOC|nr:unnamed protein product [Clonostachys rosea]
MPSLKLHVPWLLLLFLSTTVASASDDALTRLAAYPDCAKPCILSAIKGGICGLNDQACICGSTEFSANVTSCVETKCTIPESLAVLNTSHIDCDEVPRDQSIKLKVATITVGTVAGLFVILRFAYKLIISNMILTMDDWLTLATMIVLIPNLIITVNGTIPNGLGRDIWTLQPDEITIVIRFFFITAVLYFALTALVKLLFLSFYLKVFPTRVVQQILWGTFAVTALWGIGFVFLVIFQCQPISYFWKKWDGLHDGTCLDANTIGWANASSGIALDLWILAIPLLQLRKLQLKWKKKIGVVLMFLVGAL